MSKKNDPSGVSTVDIIERVYAEFPAVMEHLAKGPDPKIEDIVVWLTSLERRVREIQATLTKGVL